MLLWVLQNSNLKLEDKNGNIITEKQYMENELELIDGSTDSIEESNNINGNYSRCLSNTFQFNLQSQQYPGIKPDKSTASIPKQNLPGSWIIRRLFL